MVTKVKSKAKTELKPKIDYIAVAVARMNGTQEKSPVTMSGYISTWKRFLAFVGKKGTFSSVDIDKYLAKRRKDGISARTRGTEFFQLKALCVCNKIEWPFLKYDVPRAKEDAATPMISADDLEKLILAQDKYTDAERFYLAVATTFGCRREAMAQIRKRDYDDRTFLIRGVHGGETVKHAIPDAIRPILETCWSGEHQTRALTEMFTRICHKAGVQLAHGFGWHSVRRCVTSVMSYVLPKEGLQASFWAEFTGWAKASRGTTFMNSPMMGHYTHPEVLNSRFMQRLKVLPIDSPESDPYWMDHSIYKVHPFLKVWDEVLNPKPALKRSGKPAKAKAKAAV